MKRQRFCCLTRLEWNLEWMLTLIVSSYFALSDIRKLSVCPILPFQWLLLLVFILSLDNVSPPFADYTSVSGVSRNCGWPRIGIIWFHQDALRICLVSKRATFPQLPIANLLCSSCTVSTIRDFYVCFLFLIWRRPYFRIGFNNKPTFRAEYWVDHQLHAWKFNERNILAILQDNLADCFSQCCHILSFNQTLMQPHFQVAAKAAAWSVHMLPSVLVSKMNTAAQSRRVVSVKPAFPASHTW